MNKKSPETRGIGSQAERLRNLGFSDPATAVKTLDGISSSTPLRPHMERLIALTAGSPSPDGALNNLENIIKGLNAPVLAAFLKDAKNLERLAFIAGSSPFLSGILGQDPSLFEWLFLYNGLGETKDRSAFDIELKALTSDMDTFDRMSKALRKYKQREFLRLGSRDLLGESDVTGLIAGLSDLAFASLEAALSFSIKTLKREFGTPIDKETGLEPEMAIIGLGKLGGGELNFSSDIDIVYVYSSANGETLGTNRPASKIALHDFFVRVAVSVNKLISNITEDGFVFRIDLDLRPDGKAGEICNTLQAMEVYYESWGQAWERAAMIKAFPGAGSKRLGERFMSMITPFVYRRYLDFTALDEIKAMKEKIDLSLLRNAGDRVDVKLGRGGIREIEFFCQAHELIHGGKDPDVRERSTLRALERLNQKGLVKDEEKAVLEAAYVFLRNLEHRMQIVNGARSQAMPVDGAELQRVSKMMGFKDAGKKKAKDAFLLEYRRITDAVHDVYRTLFYKTGDDLYKPVPKDILALAFGQADKDGEKAFSSLGFKDPAEAYKNFSLMAGAPEALRFSQRGSVLFKRLLPLFVSNALIAPDPDMAMANMERFTSSSGVRYVFYSLLLENPATLKEFMKILGTSAFLSRSLIERPENIDLLLSSESGVPYKTKDALYAEVAAAVLERASDYEQRLDRLRSVRSEEVFRIGVNDVAGGLAPRMVSTQMTHLAEACLDVSYRVALEGLEEAHGRPTDPRFAIIGLGRLGGNELTYGSDLDVIFVYANDGAFTDKKTGRTLTNHEFFVKIGQRIITLLTLRTKEGIVFNVDTRLRPSGSSGPLVTSEEAFVRYHLNRTTPVWERQAMIKARPVAADVAFGRKVLKEIEDCVFQRGLSTGDVKELLRVRKRMEVEIAKEDGSKYNVKSGKGGLVDIEFLAEALQLANGRLKGIRTPVTRKALSRLEKAGLLARADFTTLKDAYAFYRLLEAGLRIMLGSATGNLYSEPLFVQKLARRCGYSGNGAGKKLLKDYKALRDRVRAIYLKTLENI